MAYAIDDGEVKVWHPGATPMQNKVHNGLAGTISAHDTKFEAHNAWFEKCIWENIMHKRYGWPSLSADQWSCSMALCASKGLPMALGDVAEVLQLPQRKDTRGKLLLYKINKPIPGKLTPEETEILYEYCKQDVATEREITRRVGEISPVEQVVWQIDQKVNFGGIKLDRGLAEKALKIVEQYTAELEKEIPKLTGNAITSTRQRDKTITWLQKNGLPKLESVDKENVTNALKTATLSKSVRRVLEIRQQVSKTSTAKIQTMLNSADASDGRIRGCFQYHGASTGRWSGRLVQFQNMPRGSIKDVDTCIDLIRMGDVELLKISYDDVMGAVSSCLRGLLIPEKGYSFVASDYAAIETRVLFWLAGETEGVKKLKEDKDIYIDMAESIYRVKGLDKKDPRRQLGKTTILGCLAKNTLIYSDSGTKYIQDINLKNKVWDGEKWVEHGGLLEAGLKRVTYIECLDLWLTLDHLVLTPNGWRTAAEIVLNADIKPLLSERGSGFSSLSAESLKKAKSAMSIFAAAANLKRVLESTSYGAVELRRAFSVLRVEMGSLEETQIATQILSLTRVLERDGVRVGVISGEGVQTLVTKTSQGMELAVLPSDSGVFGRSWNTLLRFMGGMIGVSPLIALIIPKGIDEEISEWSLRKTTIKTKVEACYDILDAGDTQTFQAGDGLVHNCGYGMGHKKFVDTCKKVGIDITEEFSQTVIQTYRNKYLSVVQFWYAVEKAAREAVAQKKTVELRNKIKFEYNGAGALRLVLPSGRKILYHEPKIEYDDKQRPRLSFMGVNSLTRRWSREDTYGGKLVENIVQAVSRDILAEAMYAVVQKGIRIAIHVHDEIVIETKTPEKDEKFLVKVMSTPPRWATGLPLKAETWVGKRYRK